MVRVLADGALESRRVVLCVAGEAEVIADGAEIRRAPIAVDIVAIEAADSAMIHNALHKVVALHPVFVGGEVGVLQEVCDAGL